MKSIKSEINKTPSHSELRQDPVSGDWSIIAPKRARRPLSRFSCPFDNLKKAAGKRGVLAQRGLGNDWRVAIIENKYPALMHEAVCAVPEKVGPYKHLGGVGSHDLVLTRSHKKNFHELSLVDATDVFSLVVAHIELRKKDPCLAYFLFFQNSGVRAGASQKHPHYQIITIPIIPPGVSSSLENSRRHFQEHNRCLHCEAIAYEKEAKVRLVYENENAIVFAPFASTHYFEMRVFPKKHGSRFEHASQDELVGVVEALQKGVGALMKAAGKPDYNFLLHTAPLKGDQEYQSYHWHIEVMPRLQTFAGFELGTGMIINQVAPEHAAQLLRRAL